MEYRPGLGSSLSKEKAQIVGQFLEQMGEFSPSDVVEAARPDNSPLHQEFTWDNLSAAEKWRLQEARHLINTLVIVIRNPASGKDEETKAFHSITLASEDESIERRYTAIRIVAASEPRRDQVIENALQQLESWSARHKQYGEIFGTDIFAAIEKTTQRVRARRPRTREVQPQI